MKAAALALLILYDSGGPRPAGWGYSALVEFNGKRILFDAGGDAALFERNARALGVDLSRIDYVAASHGHPDHTAGLAAVVRANPRVQVFVPHQEFGAFGTNLLNSFLAGLPVLPRRLRPERDPAPGANYVRVDRDREIGDGLRLVVTTTSELRELAIVAGPLLVSACSHAGIEKVLDASRTRPRVIAGGLHTDDPAVAPILKSRVERVAPGHCTGAKALAALRASFGANYVPLGAGERLVVLP